MPCASRAPFCIQNKTKYGQLWKIVTLFFLATMLFWVLENNDNTKNPTIEEKLPIYTSNDDKVSIIAAHTCTLQSKRCFWRKYSAPCLSDPVKSSALWTGTSKGRHFSRRPVGHNQTKLARIRWSLCFANYVCRSEQETNSNTVHFYANTSCVWPCAGRLRHYECVAIAVLRIMDLNKCPDKFFKSMNADNFYAIEVNMFKRNVSNMICRK